MLTGCLLMQCLDFVHLKYFQMYGMQLHNDVYGTNVEQNISIIHIKTALVVFTTTQLTVFQRITAIDLICIPKNSVNNFFNINLTCSIT